MTEISSIQLRCSRRRYWLTTDTGWHSSWWAMSERGLHAHVRIALRSCGFPFDRDTTCEIVRYAREGTITIEDISSPRYE